jgi:hypothetical protein
MIIEFFGERGRTACIMVPGPLLHRDFQAKYDRPHPRSACFYANSGVATGKAAGSTISAVST